MVHDVFVLLWLDDGVPQCAVYEEEEQAERDAEVVGGRVEHRMVHLSERLRAGRFAQG